MIHRVGKGGNNNTLGMHKLRQTDSASRRGHKVSLPKLRGDPDKTLRKMQKIRKTLQVPKMRIHGTIVFWRLLDWET